MSVEDLNGGQAPSQEAVASTELFNEAIPVQSEDSGLIPMRFNFYDDGNHDDDDDEPENANADANAYSDANADADELENVIKDEELDKLDLSKNQPKDEESVEELIAKLKEKGIEVKTPEAKVPESEIEKQKIERIDNFLQLAEDFLKQDDISVIKDSIINEVTQKYQRLGKQDLIGSEDFDLEVGMELSEYENNPRASKIYADNIRLSISEKINLNKSEKNKILSAREESEKAKRLEERVKIKETISKFNKEKLFGMEATPEILQDVYNSIVSNEISKIVNSDPEIIAEVAFYVKNRDSIKENFGKATFGEGVKATVDAITGKNAQQTPTSLNNAMNGKSSNTSGNFNKQSLWGDEIVKPEEVTKTVSSYVAGSR